MKKFSKLIKVIAILVTFTFISFPVYAINQSDEIVSKMSTADITAEYHKFFDLNSLQKKELLSRGYSEKEIANLDKEDFSRLKNTWKLTKDQIFYVKGIYPELKNTDLSNWTNANFDNYSQAQTNKIYAPNVEQAVQLQKKGISLDMARKMLKEYHSYDNLLSQSDSDLNELEKLIIKTDQQYNDFVNYKNAIKRNYK